MSHEGEHDKVEVGSRPGLQLELQVPNLCGHNPLGLLSLLQWSELGPDTQKSAYFWALVYGLSLLLLVLKVPEPSLPMSVSLCLAS